MKMIQKILITLTFLKASSMRMSTMTALMKSSSCPKNDQIQCSCPCDIKSGICDLDCCCDSDCSVTQMKSFAYDCRRQMTLLGSGSRHGKRHLNEKDGIGEPLQKNVLKCGENRRMNKIVSDEQTDFDFQRLIDFVEDEMDQLLCLHYDNSAVTGEFFRHDEHDFTPKAIDRQAKLDDFNFVYKGDQFYLDDFAQSPYSNGDYIIAKIKSDSNEEESAYSIESKLSLPGPGDGGICAFEDAVQFGVDLKSSCWLVFDNLERSCNHGLNIDRLVNKISVQSIKGKLDSFVNVKVERIVSEDGEEIINLDRPYTLWDEGMQSCNHSLESLKYEIYHDSGTITEAKAILNWKNIGTGTKLLQQKYELSFFSVNQQTSNNQNQGYLFHSPTLAAKVEGETVNVANEGFAIMNAGKCINQNTSKIVGFGEDMSVTCTVALDKNELQDLCISLDHELLTRIGRDNQLFVPQWFTQEDDSIAVFGDVDPNKKEEWVSIESDVDSSGFVGRSRGWNPFQKKCEGMTTKIGYRFYWTYFGEVNSPQAKIIRVTKEHDGSIPLIHKYHDDYKQNFRFTATVSWTFVEPKKRVESLPLPSLLFTVPDDVFYPFQRTSSQGKLLPSTLLGFCFFIFYNLGEMII